MEKDRDSSRRKHRPRFPTARISNIYRPVSLRFPYRVADLFLLVMPRIISIVAAQDKRAADLLMPELSV
jgi:hypothetical protein